MSVARIRKEQSSEKEFKILLRFSTENQQTKL